MKAGQFARNHDSILFYAGEGHTFNPQFVDPSPLRSAKRPTQEDECAFDGGLVLLREAERRLGLAEPLAGCIRDQRNQAQVVHALPAMLRFRMLAIACGGAVLGPAKPVPWEDADDCDALRADPVFKPSAFERNDGSRIGVQTDDNDPVRQDMADRPEQAVLELNVFEEFRKRSGLPIDPASVEKRDPPEPDIFCKIDGQGGVAFELAALLDQKSAKIRSDLAKEDEPDASPYLRVDSRKAIRHVCRSKRNKDYCTLHPMLFSGLAG